MGRELEPTCPAFPYTTCTACVQKPWKVSLWSGRAGPRLCLGPRTPGTGINFGTCTLASSRLAQENPSREALFFQCESHLSWRTTLPRPWDLRAPGLFGVAPAAWLVYLGSRVPGPRGWSFRLTPGAARAHKEPRREDCAVYPAPRGGLPPVKWGQQGQQVAHLGSPWLRCPP